MLWLCFKKNLLTLAGQMVTISYSIQVSFIWEYSEDVWLGVVILTE
jgi:hypothetical protein